MFCILDRWGELGKVTAQHFLMIALVHRFKFARAPHTRLLSSPSSSPTTIIIFTTTIIIIVTCHHHHLHHYHHRHRHQPPSSFYYPQTRPHPNHLNQESDLWCLGDLLSWCHISDVWCLHSCYISFSHHRCPDVLIDKNGYLLKSFVFTSMELSHFEDDYSSLHLAPGNLKLQVALHSDTAVN